MGFNHMVELSQLRFSLFIQSGGFIHQFTHTGLDGFHLHSAKTSPVSPLPWCALGDTMSLPKAVHEGNPSSTCGHHLRTALTLQGISDRPHMQWSGGWTMSQVEKQEADLLSPLHMWDSASLWFALPTHCWAKKGISLALKWWEFGFYTAPLLPLKSIC